MLLMLARRSVDVWCGWWGKRLSCVYRLPGIERNDGFSMLFVEIVKSYGRYFVESVKLNLMTSTSLSWGQWMLELQAAEWRGPQKRPSSSNGLSAESSPGRHGVFTEAGAKFALTFGSPSHPHVIGQNINKFPIRDLAIYLMKLSSFPYVYWACKTPATISGC
jgi:hypothetical protein